MTDPTCGYAPVNGIEMYWERRGAGGPPLVVVHGGFGLINMATALLDELARHREVVAVELQGHGHTADIDRPFTYEGFADDLAGLIGTLDLGPADLLGYSLGGGVTLRCAIQHPALVRRLAVVSAPYRRDGWFPEVLEGMAQVGSAGFEMMRQSPMYEAWVAVAPDPTTFPTLMDRTGALLARPYDWTAEVAALTVPTLIVLGDADSIPPSHAADFFALLGGGRRDAGWDGTLPTPHRLAVLPGRTHYDIFSAPELAAVVDRFLT